MSIKEQSKERQQRAALIVNELVRLYPEAQTSLRSTSPFELLIATILSAQCTDERVNIVTQQLFQKYRTPHDYATIAIEELETDIKSTGFYHNKARNIKACCQVLIDRFECKVPETMEELIQLPGVGRKTANVILGNYHGIPSIIVDTHVKRIAQRLGLTENQNPDKIEFDLQEVLDPHSWTFFSNALIYHGRKTCKAQKPVCPACDLNQLCPFPKKTE